MSSARTPRQTPASPDKLNNGLTGQEVARAEATKPDFKAIRKRIAKRFPRTIEHLAK